MHPVVSSNIAAAGYDPVSKVVEIQFSTGAKYQYSNVPKEVYEGMWSSESVGKYVHQKIAGKYKFKKMGAPKK